jgi:hypothetical protein
MAENIVKVVEQVNKVVVSSPGPQGPRGKSILNGVSSPLDTVGIEGDFYFNTTTNEFYGPKLSNVTWSGANKIDLVTKEDIAFVYSWEMSQVQGPVSGVYSVVINHNLGFSPNVTVLSSAGDVLETGIDYNSLNSLTLTMAQPFSGTAHLS